MTVGCRLGAFTCLKHAGVPIYYFTRLGLLTPFCANHSPRARRICSDSGIYPYCLGHIGYAVARGSGGEDSPPSLQQFLSQIAEEGVQCVRFRIVLSRRRE